MGCSELSTLASAFLEIRSKYGGIEGAGGVPWSWLSRLSTPTRDRRLEPQLLPIPRIQSPANEFRSGSYATFLF
jgi:hypothetical protein